MFHSGPLRNPAYPGMDWVFPERPPRSGVSWAVAGLQGRSGTAYIQPCTLWAYVGTQVEWKPSLSIQPSACSINLSLNACVELVIDDA